MKRMVSSLVAALWLGASCFPAQVALGETPGEYVEERHRQWEQYLTDISGKPGRYVLLWEKDPELCRRYKENINSSPRHAPMPYERDVNPKFKEFSRPQWQPFDHNANMDIVERLMDILVPAVTINIDKYKSELLEAVRSGESTLGWAMIDVNNDGIEEKIFRLNHKLPVDPETGSISQKDFIFGGFYNGYVSFIPYLAPKEVKESSYYDLGLVEELSRLGGLFSYRGQVYFDVFDTISDDRFWEDEDKRWVSYYPALIVYRGHGPKFKYPPPYDIAMDKVCVYQWVTNPKQER